MNRYLKNVYSRIFELSSLQLQRKLWLNQNNDTGLVSSYNELMCSLFDDFNFNMFVGDKDLTSGLSKSTVVELKILNDMLDKYMEKESDEKIITDPNWIKITNQAKIVIDKWNK